MLKNEPILPRSGEKNSKFVFPQKKSFGESSARGASASAKEEQVRNGRVEMQLTNHPISHVLRFKMRTKQR